MKIILASASPRRRELLQQIGLEFEVIPSKGEEKITEQMPAEAVMELAEQKAEEVAERAAFLKRDERDVEDLCVIGADTIVVKGRKILGKPEDERDVARMLAELSGDTHQVYTGVCLIFCHAEKKTKRLFCEKTDVSFYPMSEKEILNYAATGDPLDKAGAYGIQGSCAKYIRGIRGDYNNVVGLPVGRLYQELKQRIKPEML